MATKGAIMHILTPVVGKFVKKIFYEFRLFPRLIQQFLDNLL